MGFICASTMDKKLLTRDFSCILPGSVHDAYAFKKSSFSMRFPNTVGQSTVDIYGIEMPYLVIGDPAYPLLKWLMKNYIGNNLDSNRNMFNTKLHKARVKVETAIGRLKSRWRLLLKKSDLNYAFMPKVIGACCCLHNIIEKTNITQTDIINCEEIENENHLAQPSNSVNTNDSIEGSEIRDVLCRYLWNKQ